MKRLRLKQIPLYFILLVLAGQRYIDLSRASEASGELDPAELVVQLGDDSYETRLAAEARLLDASLAAKDALLEGLENPDVHVQRCCRRILEKVLRDDLRHRLQMILKDPEAVGQLPSWSAFRSLAGDEKSAREFFVRLASAETGLLESYGSDARAGYDAAKLRIRQLYMNMYRRDVKQRKPPSVESMAALLLVLSDPQFPVAGQDEVARFFPSLLQRGFVQQIKSGPDKETLRRLLGGWIRNETSVVYLPTKLRYAAEYDLKQDGLAMIARCTDGKRPEEVDVRTAGYVIAGIAKLGGRDYAERITPFLADERMLNQRVVNKQPSIVQVRDAAMAYQIYLTGQAHADYGMPKAKSFFDLLKRSPTQLLNFTNFGFKDEEARRAAHKNWSQWVEANPLSEPPPWPELPRFERKPLPETAKHEPDATGTPDVEAGERPQQLLVADRLLTRRIRQSRELVAQQRYTEATRLLGGLIASDVDYFFTERSDDGARYLRQLRSEAELALSQFPAAALDAYELQYGVNARRRADKAIAASNIRMLEEVQRKYLHTKAGAESAYVLASSYRTQGQPLFAVRYFQRLARTRYAANFQPSLAIQWAACCVQVGMAEQADEILAELNGDTDRDFKLGGEDVADRRGPAVLAALVGQMKMVTATGTLSELPSEAASAPTGPYMESAQWTEQSIAAPLAAIADSLHTKRKDQRLPTLTTLRPLVVGDVAVLRAMTEIRAIDLATGEPLWSAPVQNALHGLLASGVTNFTADQKSSISRGIEQCLWQDPNFGRLATDGHRVFVLEDIVFPLDGYQRLAICADGTRQMELAWDGPASILSAYELGTGKLLWEAGRYLKLKNDLEGCQPIAPPLAAGGRLYVVAVKETEARLLSLSPATGRLERQWILDFAEPEPPSRTATYVPSAKRPQAVCPPKYAGGILICPVNERTVVAFDPASESVLWTFRAPDGPAPARGTRTPVPLNRQRWVDAQIVAAGDRILVTLPGCDAIFCLRTESGQLLWSEPRVDGLYIAGMRGDVICVVGRDGVRGLRVADGRPAWPPILFPGAGAPSGRGYFDPNHYYVPLTTGEVLAVDDRRGQIAGRYAASGEVLAGTLVPAGDGLITQQVNTVSRLQSVERRAEALAARQADGDDGAALLAELGRLDLQRGRIDSAIQRLEASLQTQPDATTKRSLAAAILAGLRRDFARYEKHLPELDELRREKVIGTAHLFELADIYQTRGQPLEALETYLLLVTHVDEGEKATAITSSRSARRRYIIAAHIRQIVDKLDQQSRAPLMQLLEEELQSAAGTLLPDIVDFHPAAQRLRLAKARELVDQGRYLDAELLLQSLACQAGELSGPAVAQLAALYGKSGRTADQVAALDVLKQQYSDVICLDGKSGRQLFDDASAEPALAAWLRPGGPWPQGSFKADNNTDEKRSRTYAYPVHLSRPCNSVSTPLTVFVDSSRSKLTALSPDGSELWKCELPKFVNVSGRVQVTYGGFHGAQVGNLLIVWLAQRIVAIDGFSGRMLWQKDVTWRSDLVNSLPAQMRQALFNPQQRQEPDRVWSRFPAPFVATPGYVAFQRGRDLVAVHPTSGELLWQQDGVSLGNDLRGDQDVLLVQKIGSTQADVFSALDGRRLGTRQVPEMDDRVAVTGRHAVVWKESSLCLTDLWTGAIKWRRDFNTKFPPWPVDHRSLAVLADGGRLHMLAVETGQSILETQIGELPEALDAFAVMRIGDCYLVVANVKPPQRIPVTINRPQVGNLRVNGRLVAIDAQNGTVRWFCDLQQQSLSRIHPARLPVLILYCRYQEPKKMANNAFRYGQAEGRLLCLDLRTGKRLHESSDQPSYDVGYMLSADLKKGRIEVSTSRRRLTLSHQP